MSYDPRHFRYDTTRFALNPGQQCEDCRYFDENESARQSRKQHRSTAEWHRRSYLSGQSLARAVSVGARAERGSYHQQWRCRKPDVNQPSEIVELAVLKIP